MSSLVPPCRRSAPPSAPRFVLGSVGRHVNITAETVNQAMSLYRIPAGEHQWQAFANL